MGSFADGDTVLIPSASSEDSRSPTPAYYFAMVSWNVFQNLGLHEERSLCERVYLSRTFHPMVRGRTDGWTAEKAKLPTESIAVPKCLRDTLYTVTKTCYGVSLYSIDPHRSSKAAISRQRDKSVSARWRRNRGRQRRSFKTAGKTDGWRSFRKQTTHSPRRRFCSHLSHLKNSGFETDCLPSSVIQAEWYCRTSPLRTKHLK